MYVTFDTVLVVVVVLIKAWCVHILFDRGIFEFFLRPFALSASCTLNWMLATVVLHEITISVE